MQGHALTDTELWKLVQDHNRDAYGILYQRYVELIFVEIHKRVENRSDAEDLTQEVFQAIWEKRNSIEIKGRFFSYCWRSAQNRTLNYFRGRKLSADLVQDWTSLPEIPADNPEYFEVPPETLMQAVLDEERLRLPDRMRQVYELRFGQELPVEEIARQLFISSNTVNNHLKAMRRRFAEALRKAIFLLSFFS